jgi:hypothetical protein
VPEYASLNALKATAVIKLHDYAVQHLVARSNVLFSAGDKRVQATNLRTMSKWATITTETSSVDVLTTYEHSLFAGAGHGAIREFPVTHNPAKMAQVIGMAARANCAKTAADESMKSTGQSTLGASRAHRGHGVRATIPVSVRNASGDRARLCDVHVLRGSDDQGWCRLHAVGRPVA